MENHRWLTKTGPGMLTSIDTNQMIFPFHAELDQAHIVLFLEWSQSQHRAEDGRCFDTDEHCRMHTAGHRLTRRSDHVEVHRVLIDLGEQSRSWNGDQKRPRRAAFPWDELRPVA